MLYQLPRLLDAVKNGETVFIAEGEKDCNNLAALGLVATTSPMGAGKWRDYYSNSLQGANVVILADNDDAGRKHAQQVAKSLSGKAKIKVIEFPDLPEKGDVSDWLGSRQGHLKKKAKLLQLVADAPGGAIVRNRRFKNWNIVIIVNNRSFPTYQGGPNAGCKQPAISV